MKKIYTAEYVSQKHPDKMCDRISDRILEEFLKQDPASRVAIETLGGHGKVFLVGEITSNGSLLEDDYKKIIAEITGNDTYELETRIVQQSNEIAQGVDNGGAGDQGIVIGYACSDNTEMLPHEYYLAKSLCTFLYEKYPYDGKTQITLSEDFEILAIVTSFQNTKTEVLTRDVKEWVRENNLTLASDIKYFINPAGEWNIGGFDADTGLTGRKIVVDSYGPRVPVGGGAFSGKDWTKVDKSGALYARYIAQEILKEQSATAVRVELAYAIGISEAVQAIAYVDGTPISIDNFDTSMVGIKKYINSL